MTATCWVSVSSGDPYTPGMLVCGHPLPCADHPLVDEAPELRARLEAERAEAEFWSRCRREVAKAFFAAGHDYRTTDGRILESQVRYDVMEALVAQQLAQLGRKP